MVMEKLIKKLNTNPTPKKKLPRSSTAAAYSSTVTFGLPLKDIVDRDRTDIPLIVMDIFDYLFNNHGLEAEGIFRVNGNSRTVDNLRNLMDENGARWRVSDLSDMTTESERSVDVFSVASLLKLYLRELPGGLIPAKVTPLFLETYYSYRDNRAACFSQLEQLIASLPAPNYTLLQHLCHFLYKIWNCRAENKMSAEALGIVFGPNVFRLNQNAEVSCDDQRQFVLVDCHLLMDALVHLNHIKICPPHSGFKPAFYYAIPYGSLATGLQLPLENTETIHDQGTVNRIMTFMIEHATQLFRMTAPSCANVTHLCSAAELLGPDQPVLVSMSPKAHGKSNANPSRSSDRLAATAHPNSNSSSTDSLSQSTTIGFNVGFNTSAPLGTYETCTTGVNELSSPKTGVRQTNDFSAGLAAAIRICIEEHAFRTLITPELSKAIPYNDEGIDNLDVGDVDSETVARSKLTTNKGQTEHEHTQDPSFTKYCPASPGPNVTGEKLASRIHLEEANRKPNEDVLIQLTQRLHQIKTRLRDYERQFECASGHKPSTSEKRADSQIRALMNELANIRATVKQISTSSTTVSYELGQPVSTDDRLDCGIRSGDKLDTRELSVRNAPIASQTTLVCTSDFLSPAASRNRFATPLPPKHMDQNTSSSPQDGTNTSYKESVRCSSGYDMATTIPPARTLPTLDNQNLEIQCFKTIDTSSHKAEPSLAETYAVLIHRLAEKRSVAKRPEDLHLMTPKQIEAEKLAIQKALLYFEGLHGRPKGRQERLVMRPLYDRYRNVKRLLNALQQNTKPPISDSFSKSEFNKFDTVEDHPDISSDGDLAVRGNSDCQFYVPSGCSTVDSGDYNSTIAARIPSEKARANDAASDEEVELVVRLDPTDSDCQWSTQGSMFRRFRRDINDRKHSRECLRDQSAFSSGDEESPVYIVNNSADHLPPGSVNKSSTLPSSVTWVSHRTGHLTEMSDCQSRIPGVNNEWFGSFRHATNRGILKTEGRQSGSDVHFRSSAGTASPEHQASSELNSPSHHLSSSGRGKSSHSPMHGATGVYLTEPRTVEPRTDQLGEEKIASQKLSKNRRILSSPSEHVSTHTASDNGQAMANHVMFGCLCVPYQFCSTQPTSSSSLAGWSVSQLQTELQSVRESKRQLQKTLKDYEHEFQNATGHKVERADRLCMRAEYNQYKALKTRLLQLETELNSRLC
ncbi:uncharacterized protein DEA37_0003772 [Paragonimus westermani]|uniref:Rho-GAP domain-containing protein n=1 Tax=Paragonimus westermani TaxID=34504 RepID=A0A5J4NWY0_9TREM|nr:uncharacterized protein DEA37_0003772 [Paragonimus westermani]